MNVIATGTCRPRANARRSGAAPRRRTPLPASTIGRSDAANRRAAWAMASSVGSGKYGIVRLERADLVAVLGREAARFSGSSMCVGPGFSSVATRKALRTISGIASTRSTRVFHFVTGASIWTISTTWWASLWSLSEEAWPVIATIGARSRYASAMPVTRFVAPGPSVPIATAARPVRRPWTSAMNAAPCSCRVVTWRTDSVRDSASRMSIVSSPGTEKTQSQDSAARQSTRRSAAVRAGRAGAVTHRV